MRLPCFSRLQLFNDPFILTKMQECVPQFQTEFNGQLDPLRGLGQGLERVQRPLKADDFLPVPRMLNGTLTRTLPGRNRRLVQTCFGVMTGQQFRLRLDEVRKAILQYLRNLLVDLLPCAP